MVFVLTILFFGHSGNGNERFPGGYITSSVNGADQVCYSAYDQHDNLLVRDCNVEAK
jgi:hypothetical protein